MGQLHMCPLPARSAKQLTHTLKKRIKMVLIPHIYEIAYPCSIFVWFLIELFPDMAVLVPLQASAAQPSSVGTFTIMPAHAQWDDSSILISTSSGNTIPSQDEFTNMQVAECMKSLCMSLFAVLNLNRAVVEWNFPALIMAYNVTDSADIGSKGATRIDSTSVSCVGSMSRTLPSSDMSKQKREGPVLHGKLNHQ